MYTPDQLTRNLSGNYAQQAASNLLGYNANRAMKTGERFFMFECLCGAESVKGACLLSADLRQLNEESTAITLTKLLTMRRPEVKQWQKATDLELQLGIRPRPR